MKVGGRMNNAELILNIYDSYNARTREEILNNLNIAVELGKSKKLPVDRYVALPKVTNRSKHTVMSWFNRKSKIPLVDLCMIAKYLQYNIFSFFTTKENCKVTREDFLLANDYNNFHYPVDSAEIFCRAFELQYNVDKNLLIDNVEHFYGTTEEMLKHHKNERQKKIMEICNCSYHTYIAWFNRSRTDVKIPLISICLLAVDSNVDVFYFFEVHKAE